MNNNNNFGDINSGRDTNVSITQTDTGGQIALMIVQAILGVIVAIIFSPVLIPMMIMESRGKRSENDE